MSIISAVMGAVASGGSPTPSVTLTSISNASAREEEQLTVTLDFLHWNNTDVYWYLVNDGNTAISNSTQVTPNAGVLYSTGTGSFSRSFNFTFNADATTDGTLTYYIRIEDEVGNLLVARQGPYTVIDTSQAPELVLDVDPASLGTMYGLTTWPDASGKGNNLFINNGTTSTDNGGVLIFNGSTTSVVDTTDNIFKNAVFSSVTVSAWIKPSAVNVTQTIISKEICYKMIITSDGRIAWMVGDVTGNSWTTTIYASAGLVTTSTWSHVMATVDTDATKIYINGVLAQTGGGATLIVNNYRFAIGAYDTGSSTYGDYFSGRMGEVKMWNYALTSGAVALQYNNTAARYGQSLVPQSLSFNGTQHHELFVNGSPSDWALGTSGTIEWWQKTSKNSNDFGGNFNGGMIVQGNAGGSGGLDIFNAGGFLDVGLGGGGVQPYATEPSTGTWVHVALSFATNPGNTSTGINHVYFNGVEQSLNNTSARLSNSTDILRVGNRVPGANYQNWTGQISNLHISTATLYTGEFTPMIRTATTTGTVLLLDYYNPLVDLSYYELNGVALTNSNGTNLFISTSTYPNLINQIQIGNTVVSDSTSTIVVVTGQVFLADPSNWGIPISTGLIFQPNIVTFSGARHTTTGTVTLTTDAPV